LLVVRRFVPVGSSSWARLSRLRRFRSPHEGPVDVRLTGSVVVITLGSLMSAVDSTVTNVALNVLRRDLHSSITGTQWVISAYLLALAAVIPVSGWAARRFGTRRTYITSLVLFTTASGLCALATSTLMLVSLRALQGAAGGMIAPTGQMIAAKAAGPDRMGRVMSRIWVAIALATVFGPTLGGLIVDDLGWRWIFLINLPVGAVSVLAAVCILPDTGDRQAERLQIGGFLRLSLGVPALMFGLSQAATGSGLSSLSVVAPFIIGVPLIVSFAKHASRCERPLLSIHLYAKRAFAAGSSALCCVNIGWYAVLVLLPLYFQEVRYDTAALSGLLLAPQGFGMALGMWFAGRATDGPRSLQLGMAGAVGYVLATVPLGLASPTTSVWAIAGTRAVAGFACGLAWVPAVAASYAGLRSDEISDAAPLLTVTTRVGASIGAAAAAIILQLALTATGQSAAQTHLSAAYGTTFWLVVAISAVALVPYSILLGTTRSGIPSWLGLVARRDRGDERNRGSRVGSVRPRWRLRENER
jgi:EmrB/QacA subfamily drug resistance transporter